MLILWTIVLLTWFLRFGISMTEIDFCTLWNSIFRMIFTCSNIVLIRLLGDVSQIKVRSIFLSFCHGGYFSGKIIVAKVFQCGFYWSTLFKDTYKYCRRWFRCQQLGHITRRDMMPLNPIIIVEIFDVWGIEFMGPLGRIAGCWFCVLVGWGLSPVALLRLELWWSF